MRIATSFVLLCLTSCTGTISHFQDDQRHRDLAFHEMRTEIGDLKHALQSQRTEVQILQERLSDQENLAKNAQRNKPQHDQVPSQIAACERKLLAVEKSLEKLSSDLRGLNKHAEQTSQSLASFKDKILSCQKELAIHKQSLENVSQLKTTLGQISQAIETRSSAKPSSYKVKPGDTLEKIARHNSISIAALKRLNHISQDRILVSQELKVTDDGE